MKGGTIKVGDKWGGTTNDYNHDANTPIDVEPFYIGKTEVRYELWYIVRDWGEGHGYTFQNKGRAINSGGLVPGAFPVSPSKDEPVTIVSWRDVVVWCNAYSEITGKEPVYRNKTDSGILKDSTLNVENLVDKTKIALYNGYRLPTEIEWEYAARGGVPSSSEPWTYTYAGSNSPGTVAWFYTDSSSTLHSVGQKTANSAGLYDMSGSVWEWCFIDSGTNPAVLRGGAWDISFEFCSVANRDNGFYTDSGHDTMGFRVVCR
jgi:formylglycine-generating enzyme required for sulfatase activity